MASQCIKKGDKLVFDTVAAGDLKCLEALAMKGFDFNCHHPTRGYTTLQALILDHLFPLNGFESFAKSLERSDHAVRVAEWLIKHGADPYLEATQGQEKVPIRRWRHKDIEEESTVTWTPAGHSTVSMLAKIRADMRDTKGARWDKVSASRIVEKLVHAMMCIDCESTPGEKVTVDSSLLELWDSVLSDSKSHDLTIKCADGSVTAHSHVLSAASPVVAAMLSCGMQEAARREVCVDCSSDSVQFLLELVYTGSSGRDFSTDFGLASLDLAHRWQMHNAVRMLEQAVISVLSEDNFADVVEVVTLKDLAQLKAACRRMAQEKSKLRKLAPWLAGENQRSPDGSAKKRRRVTY